MEVEIIKFDNLGRGIGYINNKIIFVPKSIPGDKIIVDIIKEKKNYLEGKIETIISPSKLRKEAICPYFPLCGGCDLMHISLTESLEYKLTKINDILAKNKIDFVVKEIIKNDKEYNYRNKITLKVIDNKIGYYLSETHKLLPITKCYLVNDSINDILKDLSKFNINNGEIIIRCNYKNELLIVINSFDNVKNIEYFVNNYNIAGIVKNNAIIYGDNYLIHEINNYLFKISYDAFFQVNDNICHKLFDLIISETTNSKNVLDLYCGVGSLSLVASKNASNVLGVEIVANAIKDANVNKCLNRVPNANFICSDTVDILDKIDNTFDTVILDPPRSGVNEKVLNKIIHEKIKKIIYVSCDPFTLVRDIKILESYYDIEEIKLLDMFTWTNHVECVCVLKLR